MSALRLGLCLISFAYVTACPKVDTVPIQNNTPFTLDIFVNCFYPDTAFSNARLNSYVNASRRGGVILVNRRWREYLHPMKAVTLFFAEEDRDAILSGGWPTGEQRVRGKMILTLAKLDSLGWVITFPDDADPAGAEPDTLAQEAQAEPSYPALQPPDGC